MDSRGTASRLSLPAFFLLALSILALSCQPAFANWYVSTEPDTLVINGDGSSDDLQVQYGRSGSRYEIEIAGRTNSFLPNGSGICRYITADKYSTGSIHCDLGIRYLRIDGRGGDDRITVNDLPFSRIDVSGGDGADSINLADMNEGHSVHGGPGNDQLISASLDGDTFGDGGDDTLLTPLALAGGSYADVRKSRNTIGASLHGGDGNDTLRGSFLTDELLGDAGHDTIYADSVGRFFGHEPQRCVRLSQMFSYSGLPDAIRLFNDPEFRQLLDDLGFHSVQEVVENWSQERCISGRPYTLNLRAGKDQDGPSTEERLLVGSNDHIEGGDGSDEIHSGEGDDEVLGGNGPDRIDGGWGEDTLLGQGDVDTLNGGNSSDRLDGGIGSDSLDGASGDDVLLGSSGTDYLLGGTGSDSLRGGGGDDELHGQLGDDGLDGGPGHDAMFGGDGTDTVSYLGSKLGVQISPNNSWDDGVAGEDYVDGGIENLIGGDANDTITGSQVANVVDGGAGNDSIDVTVGDTGEVDQVACGDDYDQVVRDAMDIIDSDCEGIF